MCGLISAIGNNINYQFVKKTVANLFWRGHDSIGVLLHRENQLKPFVHKWLSDKDFSNYYFRDATHNVFLGHTRWSTASAPSIRDAHPIKGGKPGHRWYCIHNGIISNYKTLKENLEYVDYDFMTDTDTEVIPNLFHSYLTSDSHSTIQDALYKTRDVLQGDFACVLWSPAYPNMLLGIRKGQPLWFSGGYLTSDPNTLYGYSEVVTELPDNNIIILQRRGTEVTHGFGYKATGDYKNVVRPVNELQEKGEFTHWMLKEIYEQTKVPVKLSYILNQKLETPKLISLFGCGTSYNMALLGKYYLEGISNIPTEVEYGTSVAESNFADKYRGRLNIAVSQSGTSHDVVKAVKKLKSYQCSVKAIVNRENSTLHSLLGPENIFKLDCGTEHSIAATKTASQTAVLLWLFAQKFYYDENKEDCDKYCRDSINALEEAQAFILQNSSKICQDVAETLTKYSHIFVLGSGPLYPIALEGALKIKEVSRIHAEGMNSAEVKHGSLAVLNKETLCVFLMTQGATSEEVKNNIKEVLACGSPVICITDMAFQEKGVFVIPIDVDLDDGLKPLLFNTILQLISYYTATKKGLNCDVIGRLAKCVTV